MTLSALDDALMARMARGLPAPAGRPPRRWPRFARRIHEVTGDGLRVQFRASSEAGRVIIASVAASLRQLLDPHREASR